MKDHPLARGTPNLVVNLPIACLLRTLPDIIGSDRYASSSRVKGEFVAHAGGHGKSKSLLGPFYAAAPVADSFEPESSRKRSRSSSHFIEPLRSVSRLETVQVEGVGLEFIQGHEETQSQALYRTALEIQAETEAEDPSGEDCALKLWLAKALFRTAQEMQNAEVGHRTGTTCEPSVAECSGIPPYSKTLRSPRLLGVGIARCPSANSVLGGLSKRSESIVDALSDSFVKPSRM